MSLIKKKICLLGDVGVGKTSMIRRYVENIFDDSYLSTIGVKVSQKKVAMGQTDELLLMVWDVEGVSKAGEMNKNYLSGASGAIIVEDLTRLGTIDLSADIISIFQKINPGAPFILAGNKNDLVTEKHPGHAMFNKLGQKLNVPIYFTSAKTGHNIEACFFNLAQKIIEQ